MICGAAGLLVCCWSLGAVGLSGLLVCGALGLLLVSRGCWSAWLLVSRGCWSLGAVGLSGLPVCGALGLLSVSRGCWSAWLLVCSACSLVCSSVGLLGLLLVCGAVFGLWLLVCGAVFGLWFFGLCLFRAYGFRCLYTVTVSGVLSCSLFFGFLCLFVLHVFGVVFGCVCGVVFGFGVVWVSGLHVCLCLVVQRVLHRFWCFLVLLFCLFLQVLGCVVGFVVLFVFRVWVCLEILVSNVCLVW